MTKKNKNPTLRMWGMKNQNNSKQNDGTHLTVNVLLLQIGEALTSEGLTMLEDVQKRDVAQRTAAASRSLKETRRASGILKGPLL